MVGLNVGRSSAFYRKVEKMIKTRKDNHHDLVLGINRKETKGFTK